MTSVASKKLVGAGGPSGSSKTSTSTSDNLFSTDIVEALLGISEGPIAGLKDGPRSFLIGDTPLKSVDDSNNFDSFELVVRKGSEIGETIVSRMGGFGSSTTVSTELASAVPVVRQGLHTGIDFIDIRLMISRLMIVNDSGNFQHTGKVKIEYKRTGSATWLPVQTDSYDPPPTEQTSADTDIYTEITGVTLASASPGDRTTYWQDSPPPTTSSSKAIWFDKNDNSRPYQLVAHAWVAFDNLAFASGIWTWTELSAWGKTKTTRAFVRLSTDPLPISRAQSDYLLLTDDDTIFMFNGASWIGAGSSLQPGLFGSNATGGSISVSAGEIAITGKTSSPFVKEFRFAVDNIDDDTYQLRVTKTSPENTTEKFFDVSWESFQEITTEPFTFPALATVQLTARASEQFSSIPDFSGIYLGRMIKVPSNYDPETRVYTGVWDGTWQIAYSNNPAYIVNDLVENDRYGLNAYYPVVLNKWDVYDAAVWCDTLTDDDVPRFTFNGLISEPRGCREAIDYICGTFGGRFFDDGNGSANIRIDKYQSASGLFTPENVEAGIFTYSFTESASRYNDITVTFTNPLLNYKEDRRRVFDQTHINKYGRIPLNFIAIGCNSSAEAITRGRYKLVTGVTETTIVSFKTNRLGLYHVPYDIILISDEDMNAGLSGRVKALVGTDAFTLRDPLFLEDGFQYKAIFQIPDGTGGFVLTERPLVEDTTGTIMEVPLQDDLPSEVGPDTVFSISTVTGEAVPRAFRITNIGEIDDDPDHVEVQAIEVNRIKWDYIDGTIDDLEEPYVYDLETGGKPLPIQALRLQNFISLNGQTEVYSIVLDWDPSPTKTVSRYKVFMSKDNGPMLLVDETAELTSELTNLQPGEYLFSVVAVSDVSTLTDSTPVVIEHRLVGDISDPNYVDNLRLAEQTADPLEYIRPSPIFQWDPVTAPEHFQYVVRIYDMSDAQIGEYFTNQPTFTYDYAQNESNHGGTAEREFQIGVASQDQFNQNSQFTRITVNNPTPSPPVPTFTAGIQMVNIQWDTTTIPDYAGAKIWVDDTIGFTPGSGNLVYDGNTDSYVFSGLPGVPYYMRIALYDTFNSTDAVVSAEYDFTLSSIGDIEIAIGNLSDDVQNLLGLLTSTAPGSVYTLIQEAKDEIEAQANAAYTNNTSLGKTTELLSRAINGASAAVIIEKKARVEQGLAFAEAIIEVSAQIENSLADGLLKFEALVNEDGSVATIAAKVRVTNEADYSTAAWILQATADGLGGTSSIFGVFADQFFVTSADGDVEQAFTFEDGVAKLNVIRAGQIISQDGTSMIVDFDNKFIRIESA